MTIQPFRRDPDAPFRDPSEPYDPNLDAYLCWLEALAAIRARKIASGEIKEEQTCKEQKQ